MVNICINVLIFACYSRNIRDSWIRAKYIERKFVKKLSVMPESLSQSDIRASRDTVPVRKWSVRKLRRRPRSSDARCSRKQKSTTRLCSVEEINDKSKIESEGIQKFCLMLSVSLGF